LHKAQGLKPRKQKPIAGTNPADEDMSVPVWMDPHLSPAFYKRLASIAGTCKAPRYKVIQEGIELFLQRHQEQQGLISKVAGDKATAKQVRQLLGKISKTYWDTLSEEQRRERGQKAAAARWGKKKAPES
jgi:hypothetical protein